MLAFERRVVASLLSADAEPRRAEVEAFAERSLSAMPEVLRAGVFAESIALGAWARLRGGDTAAVVRSLDASPVGLLRQYVRLFRSLVLFAENELAA